MFGLAWAFVTHTDRPLAPKWVYCVRWDGQEHRRLTTPGDLQHVEALVTQYRGCQVLHLAFEACGFGYEIAWWAQEPQIGVTVIAPSWMERAPGLQVAAGGAITALTNALA
ncbi:MAG TPA: hypothetical protein VL049_05140 [Candidatus Dormibacteraeota bacterium]|nr:hypothetical protein [Candidatus Dormibacteraeota bacterium]